MRASTFCRSRAARTLNLAQATNSSAPVDLFAGARAFGFNSSNPLQTLVISSSKVSHMGLCSLLSLACIQLHETMTQNELEYTPRVSGVATPNPTF